MKRRSKIVLGAGVVLVGIILLARPRIEYAAMSWYITRQDAPGDTAMRHMLSEARDRAVALERLWDTRKIVHREFVMDYMRWRLDGGQSLWPRMKPLTLEAACCGDFDTQQAALTVLEQRSDPDFVPLLIRMLQDVDPDVRRLAVMSLGRTRDKRLIPVFIQMLDDPDRSVRGFSAGALVTITDQDFGLHFTAKDEDADAARDMWRKWWAAQRTQSPEPRATAPTAWSLLPIGPAPDFSLSDLDGRKVRLADFKGKLVLLTFWATWCPPCLREIPSLADLHRRRSDVVVLAISTDALRDESHSSNHHDEMPQGDLAGQVKKFVGDNAIPYRVLMDNDGQVTGAYSGGDLPVGVWIDREGLIRRRFIGPREIGVLEQMANDVAQPLPKFDAAASAS